MSENLADLQLENIDLTELPGLDNLHQPEGIIAQSQALCAQWLGMRDTFFLVNGASVGIQAAVLGSTGPGDIVLVPRNAHKSLINALILSGATPVYYLPEVHPDFGLPLGQDHKEVTDKLNSYPQIKLLFALYPTYFGTTWDLQQVRTCWEGLLVVDEAHGAHFPFYEGLPISSIKLGADIVIQSSHKTLAALTQAAMMHIGTSCPLSSDVFLQTLDMLQTTSPSYILMSSLESAFWDAVQKNDHWKLLSEQCLGLKRSLSEKGLRILEAKDIGTYGISGVDPLKILVHVPDNKAMLVVDKLFNLHGIQPELWDSGNILFLISAGDCQETVKKLENALLKEIDVNGNSQISHVALPLPKQVLTPRQAYLSKKTLVPLIHSAGEICGDTISPYPPGIPVIVPGEIITKDIIEYIVWSKHRGVNWQGTSDPTLEKIKVIRETS